jgi:putative ABC transport system ATP-binding protein
MTDVVRLNAVSKVYGKGQGAVAALREVSVGIPRGTFTAVMGPSGSGKSTFLHCAAGLDRPTSGKVLLGGTEIGRLKENELTRLRRTRVGFVFQAYNLMPSLNVLQNITLPLRLAGTKPDPQWLREIVEGVGMAKRLEHRPAELSGGQQQRVAIARALIARPTVLLADEPTGNLDSRSGSEVLALLREAVELDGQTTVMVTHDPRAAATADRVLFLADGRIVGDLAQPREEQIVAMMQEVTR